MLLHDYVVSNREAKPGALSGWFGREEGIEHLISDLDRNAGAVIANRDRHAVAKVPRRSRNSRLIAIALILLFALGRRVEAVRDQVQQSPCDLLREYIDLTGGRVKGPLQGDGEALFLGPCPVIGKVEALIDQGVKKSAARPIRSA